MLLMVSVHVLKVVASLSLSLGVACVCTFGMTLWSEVYNSLCLKENVVVTIFTTRQCYTLPDVSPSSGVYLLLSWKSCAIRRGDSNLMKWLLW